MAWTNARLCGAILLTATGLGAPARAQQDPPQAERSPRPDDRPGLLKVGPFYVTPSFRIRSIGLDTNVFYTATDRRADLRAGGGPALEVVLPIRKGVRVSTTGGADYLYFLRTKSQRKLTGYGLGRIQWVGNRITGGIESGYQRTYDRPSYEVDQRIDLGQWRSVAQTALKVSDRFAISPEASATITKVAPGQTFLGADVSRNLTQDTYAGKLALGYGLTAKTSVILEGGHEAHRFPREPERDADGTRLGGGVHLVSTTRLSGRVVVGARRFRPRSPTAGPDRTEPYVDGTLGWHFGPRTRLGATYRLEHPYSAFDVQGGSPTLRYETARLRLDKGLVGDLDLRLEGGVTRLRSDGTVAVRHGSEPSVSRVRKDTAWQGGADLGYTLWSHLRFGVAAAYVDRQSTFADFGIHGLLAGGTITYVP